MRYVVKYRYIDENGDERVFFDGFDSSKKELLGAFDLSDPDICAYMLKNTAMQVKRAIDDMLETLHRTKAAKKIWKSKVIAVSERLIINGETQKADDNAALRYYYSFCIF